MNNIMKVSQKPHLTYLLIGLCVSLSMLTMVFPELKSILGGTTDLLYVWQPFTAVFIHGFDSLPMPFHLSANIYLLLFCGTITERLLGKKRFVILTLCAIFVAGITRIVSTIEFNGSSAFIWAYSPIMLIALRQEQISLDTRHQVETNLFIMWVVVSFVMGLIVYAGGYEGNILMGFLWGNLYHLTGVTTGVIVAIWWWVESSNIILNEFAER